MLFRSDRKSTRLNSSHTLIAYAVFCLKKKKANKRATGGAERGGYVRARETWRHSRDTVLALPTSLISIATSSVTSVSSFFFFFFIFFKEPGPTHFPHTTFR